VIRARSAWLVSLPLALVACLAAHSVAYRLAGGEAGGHGYLAYAPAVVAVAVAAVLAGAAARAFAAARSAAASGPPAWLFALVPPLAFVVQEHLERLGSTAAIEPAFAVGLALQLPFAALALLAARSLLRAADRLGAALRRRPRRLPRPSSARPPVVRHEPPRPSLATAHSQRGPPRR
jgi:hypothetical protein